MKKIISNEEIIEKAKKWLASFSNDEWCKKIEEENYLTELEKVKNFEWLCKSDFTIINDLPNVECEATISKDERRFTWTLSEIYCNDKKPSTPISYVEVFIDLEAA